MQKDERDLLQVLKSELKFLEERQSGHSPPMPLRPQYIFKDSPTCFNYGCFDYDCREHSSPCSDCVLIQLVPPESRAEQIPCCHIPLNASGQTLYSLYRDHDKRDVEETVKCWLKATIQRLEEERMAIQRDCNEQRPPSSEEIKAIPLYQNGAQPKCANPACPVAFHWSGGGKFFRFRPDPASSSASNSLDSPKGIHGVRHYWLCDKCSRVFTLVHDGRDGAVLKVLSPELPAAEGELKKRRFAGGSG